MHTGGGTEVMLSTVSSRVPILFFPGGGGSFGEGGGGGGGRNYAHISVLLLLFFVWFCDCVCGSMLTNSEIKIFMDSLR